MSQRVPDMVFRVFSSEMNCCLTSGIHKHSPNSHIHIQIFHRIAWRFTIDLPDHGEDGFHVVRCVLRHMEIVVSCRFRIFLTFLVNWRTGSVCKVFLPSFIVLGNKFLFVVPGSSRRIVGVFWIFFFLMRRVSPLPFRQPAKVCILESRLRRRRCVEWAWFHTHPAVGFPPSYRHPWTFRCNRTRCGGVTCRNNIRRHIHHCWSRLGRNSFSFLLILNPLRHCRAAYQAEILSTTSGAEMADI